MAICHPILDISDPGIYDKQENILQRPIFLDQYANIGV
jgi:hypothetical protein